MRRSEIERKTAETDISLSLNLDGTGKSNVDTGCGFLNHMLTLFARHGRFDLDVTCHGDVDVDDHHSVEDISICLGMAFAEAPVSYTHLDVYKRQSSRSAIQSRGSLD